MMPIWLIAWGLLWTGVIGGSDAVLSRRESQPHRQWTIALDECRSLPSAAQRHACWVPKLAACPSEPPETYCRNEEDGAAYKRWYR